MFLPLKFIALSLHFELVSFFSFFSSISFFVIFITKVLHILASFKSSKALFQFIVSYGKFKTATVRIADIDSINCTKNQVKGTIITQITNFGNELFNSHIPPQLPIIFINEIAIRINAKIKYTILEISTQISFK